MSGSKGRRFTALRGDPAEWPVATSSQGARGGVVVVDDVVVVDVVVVVFVVAVVLVEVVVVVVSAGCCGLFVVGSIEFASSSLSPQHSKNIILKS